MCLRYFECANAKQRNPLYTLADTCLKYTFWNYYENCATDFVPVVMLCTRVYLKQIASNYLFYVEFSRLNIIRISFEMATKLRSIEIREYLGIFPLCRERREDDRRYLLPVLRFVMIFSDKQCVTWARLFLKNHILTTET